MVGIPPILGIAKVCSPNVNFPERHAEMTSIPTTALPSLIDWPRDEAAHDGYPWEIWWVTARVRTGDRNLAVHVLFNRLAGGSISVGATITDLDRDEELTRKLVAQPGEGVAAADELRLETALCSFHGSFAKGYRLQASFDDGSGFDLTLSPTRPVLHNGGSGQYVFGGVTTTQYSIGFLQTSGTVRLGGRALAVTGDAWHDRQWDHWRRTSPLAFTWFGICLTNGDTLSVFDTAGGPEAPARQWATIARPDGTHIVAAVELASSGVYATALGRPVPPRWTLSVPALRARLELGQRRVADSQPLYTGVLEISGSYEGAEAGGYGFCDIGGPIS
jgi:predicted secreted hydrolase